MKNKKSLVKIQELAKPVVAIADNKILVKDNENSAHAIYVSGGGNRKSTRSSGRKSSSKSNSPNSSSSGPINSHDSNIVVAETGCQNE